MKKLFIEMLKSCLLFSRAGILAFLGAGSVEDEVDYSSYDYSSQVFKLDIKR